MSAPPLSSARVQPRPRSALSSRYAEIRSHSLTLAAPLSPEDQGVQSMPDASPTKWHLAHTTWFFETVVLQPHADNYRAFDQRFFMVGQVVLRGSSSAAPPGHARPTYRNFFPPSARWQFSGVRLAKDGTC